MTYVFKHLRCNRYKFIEANTQKSATDKLRERLKKGYKYESCLEFDNVWDYKKPFRM